MLAPKVVLVFVVAVIVAMAGASSGAGINYSGTSEPGSSRSRNASLIRRSGPSDHADLSSRSVPAHDPPAGQKAKRNGLATIYDVLHGDLVISVREAAKTYLSLLRWLQFPMTEYEQVAVSAEKLRTFVRDIPKKPVVWTKLEDAGRKTERNPGGIPPQQTFYAIFDEDPVLQSDAIKEVAFRGKKLTLAQWRKLARFKLISLDVKGDKNRAPSVVPHYQLEHWQDWRNSNEKEAYHDIDADLMSQLTAKEPEFKTLYDPDKGDGKGGSTSRAHLELPYDPSDPFGDAAAFHDPPQNYYP